MIKRKEPKIQVGDYVRVVVTYNDIRIGRVTVKGMVDRQPMCYVRYRSQDDNRWLTALEREVDLDVISDYDGPEIPIPLR